MAGGTVWRGEDVAPDDGKVSVVAFDGIIHLGNFRLGLARPHELARGRAVELAARAPLPVHVDGEPWALAGPTTVAITREPEPLPVLVNDAADAGVDALDPFSKHLIRMYEYERGNYRLAGRPRLF